MKQIPSFYIIFALIATTIFGNFQTLKAQNKIPTEPKWARKAVLYEVNLRQYTPEGTLNAFAEHLPRLAAMGIDIIWLMPIHPIGVENRKGKLGSYYSVKDYRGVSDELGTLEDFKKLVTKTHKLGMKIILDWVPNHTAWDHPWVKDHPDWYTQVDGKMTPPIDLKGVPTDWTDVVDLNYDNKEMRAAKHNDLLYWVKEYDVDGFRCDVAGWVPNDFWAEVRTALDKEKKVFMLSEHEEEPKHFESCFNANYAWHLLHVTEDVAKGKKNAQNLYDDFMMVKGKMPAHAYQMRFITNHDENTWSDSEYARYGAPAVDVFTMLTFTMEGIPLIYTGQEAASPLRLPFFEKTHLEWSVLPKENLIRTLCSLRHNNKALFSGVNGGEQMRVINGNDENVMSFSRQKGKNKVIVFANLSDKPQKCNFNNEKLAGDYANTFGKSIMTLKNGMEIALKPYEYIVLTK